MADEPVVEGSSPERAPEAAPLRAFRGHAGKTNTRASSILEEARQRLAEFPWKDWDAARVKALVDAADTIQRQRVLLYLTWCRDALILLIMEAPKGEERWQKALEIAREVLLPTEDLLHIANRDDVDPKLLERMKDAGFCE